MTTDKVVNTVIQLGSYFHRPCQVGYCALDEDDGVEMIKGVRFKAYLGDKTYSFWQMAGHGG